MLPWKTNSLGKRRGCAALQCAVSLCSASTGMLQVWTHRSCSSPCTFSLPTLQISQEKLLSPSHTQRELTHQGLLSRLVQPLSAGLINYHLFMILNVLSSPGNTVQPGSFNPLLIPPPFPPEPCATCPAVSTNLKAQLWWEGSTLSSCLLNAGPGMFSNTLLLSCTALQCVFFFSDVLD